MKHALNFELERTTKNTMRYEELSDHPKCGTIYIQQSALHNRPSGHLTVTIEEESP